MATDWSQQRIDRVFGLESHQVRHLLTTFTPGCVAREFCVGRTEVSHLRMQLGLPHLPKKRRQGINGAAGISAWRTPAPREMGAAAPGEMRAPAQRELRRDRGAGI